jgi:hypothetical protein
MANDISRAMSRLKHRDIRTRRRAVRTLFEHDDPSVLTAFKPLLDDEDGWFVSKALDAYRMWAVVAGPEAISTLLTHRNLDVRRAGANLLGPLGENGLELSLRALNDADGVVQRKAARALLRFEEQNVAERLLDHPNTAVRSTGVHHPNVSEERLRAALKDDHEQVREAALGVVLKQGIDVEMDAFVPFLEANQQTVNILIWVAEHQPAGLGELTARLEPHHMKAVSDHLRNEVAHSDDALIQHLLSVGVLEPVARWVIRQDATEDDLRWQLINDDRLHVIERSKLLERLVGRANEHDVVQRAEDLMATTDEELLKVACENLSTAASELIS